MEIAQKVCVTVADGALGERRDGCVPLVVSVRDREFVDLLSGASLTIASGSRGFGASMAMVDIAKDDARSNIMLDLGDSATRGMLASWQRYGARVELRCGTADLVVHRPVHDAHHGDIQAALALPQTPQPALFLMLSSYPRFQAMLSAIPRPEQELPAPRFLFSAALSDKHWQAAGTLETLRRG